MKKMRDEGTKIELLGCKMNKIIATLLRVAKGELKWRGLKNKP